MFCLFKRTKMFHHNVDGAEQHLLVAQGTQKVPEWIRETNTYKLGIKDESIINLTDQARKEDEAAEEKEEPKQEEPKVPAGLKNGQKK